MRMRLSFLAGVLAGVLAALTACSHDASTPLEPAVDHDAEGSWAPDNGGAIFPGNSWIVSMRETSGIITGTGAFSGEAGPFGGLEVSGTVVNDSVHLRIVYVYEPTVFPRLVPDTAQFDGLLVSRDRIHGRLGREGGFTPFRLLRAVPYDPR